MQWFTKRKREKILVQGLPHLRNGKKCIVWSHIHKERKLSHWILNFGSWESDANASKFKGHE